MVTISSGKQMDFDAAVQLMDDEVRESIHEVGTYHDQQSFMDQYSAAHAQKFGEQFAPN